MIGHEVTTLGARVGASAAVAAGVLTDVVDRIPLVAGDAHRRQLVAWNNTTRTVPSTALPDVLRERCAEILDLTKREVGLAEESA